MNRPKRDTAQVQRFKATPQTQTRGPKKPAAKAVRPPKPPKRTLDTTLKKVDAELYDAKDPNGEFYDKFFDKPDDDITKRLKALDYSNPKYNIAAFKTGITTFELKNIDTVPIRQISFKDFKDGLYTTSLSKSDGKVYSDKIKKFTNQFPSFKKYKPKDIDDLSWVVRENRLLLCEILEYAIGTKAQLPTIETELVAMMRIIYLSFGSKLTPLYIKYQAILTEVTQKTKTSEGENTFNDSELRKGGLIPWRMVLNKQKELQDRFYSINNQVSKEGYALNQDLLLISLYSLIPPLRNEPKFLEFTETEKNSGDWVLIEGRNVSLDLNEIKKKHAPIKLSVPDTLRDILLDSFNAFPRQYVFTDTLKYPSFDKKAAKMTMNNRLANLFRESTYKVGASMLRSSYVTFMFEKQITYNKKEWIAKNMRTSIDMMDRHYFKIISEPMAAIVDIPDDVIRTVAVPAVGQPNPDPPRAVVKKPVLIVQKKTMKENINPTDYEKHLEAGRKYYKKHKDRLLKKQTKYRREHKTEDARRKILKWLNNDPDYINIVRQTTIDKYKIEKSDGVYI